ncbi:MAG: HAD family hydrolase [Planctomycetia bacterium]|nr:HAD family hydrolase [Planctomycetia bacterium]
MPKSTNTDPTPRPERVPVRGIIFDLDGTLVDSALDFDAMRAEMGLSAGTALLEAIADLPPEEAERCREILHRHEHAGGLRATPIAGAAEFVRTIDALGMHRALWTRNSRAVALQTIARLQMPFEIVVARDDAPPKPDPTAVRDLCRRWKIEPNEIVVVGDYVFDIEAGRRAGARTVLYTAGAPLETCEGHELADFHLASFEQTEQLLRWMLQ